MTFINILVHIQIIMFMQHISNCKADRRHSGGKNNCSKNQENLNQVLILSPPNSLSLVGSISSRQQISFLQHERTGHCASLCFVNLTKITTNCGKFLKRWEQQITSPAPEKSVCRSRSNSQNWTWNSRLFPNRKRSTSRLYIVTLLI